MRYLAIVTAGAIIVAAGLSAQAAPVANGVRADSAIVLVQEKKDAKKPAKKAAKKETVKQKVNRAVDKTKASVKRAWKRVAGYKFDVACPAFPPLSHKICRETGKDREAARAKCQSANPLCGVSDAK